MIGICCEGIDEEIKKTNFYIESYEENVKDIIEIINETITFHSKKNLKFLFSELKNEIKNLQTINAILENYTDTLSDIKLSYLKQDERISQQINSINSKIS